MSRGLDYLLPIPKEVGGYVQGSLGASPSGVSVRGEGGYKFTPSAGAFVYAERRWLSGASDGWDAGIGGRLTF